MDFWDFLGLFGSLINQELSGRFLTFPDSPAK